MKGFFSFLQRGLNCFVVIKCMPVFPASVKTILVTKITRQYSVSESSENFPDLQNKSLPRSVSFSELVFASDTGTKQSVGFSHTNKNDCCRRRRANLALFSPSPRPLNHPFYFLPLLFCSTKGGKSRWHRRKIYCEEGVSAKGVKQ